MSILPMHARRTFAADERSVAKARRFARSMLDGWGAPELADPVVLLVSELVTNAVVHAGTSAHLELRLDAQSLRIEVEDMHPGRGLPVGVERPVDDAEHGRGLFITSAMASTWGVEYTPSSKRVWLRFERAPESTSLSHWPSERQTEEGPGRAVSVIGISEDGLVTSWNDDASLMFGWLPDEVVGKRFDELLDPTPGERGPDAPGERGTRPTARDVARGWQGTYSMLCKDGATAKVFASHVSDGRGEGSSALLVPLSRRTLLEHPAARGPARSPVDADVLGLRDDALARLGVDDYLALAVERARDRLGADAAYLLILRDLDDEFSVRAVSGLQDDLRGTRLDARAPGAPDSRNPHLPVVMTELAPGDVSLLEGTNLRSLVVVPTVAEGRVVGALAVASERPQGFSGEESALQQRFADAIALATDRARLQASERERRGWLNYLSEISVLLAASLDQDMTLAIAGQIVVPHLATWCAIHLDDDRDQPVLQLVWHEDERLIEPLRSALAGIPPGSVDDLDDPILRGPVRTMPLMTRGRKIGFLTLGRPPGNPLRGEVQLIAESVARRVAVAIDNARGHGELRDVGNALQRSLLPSSMPTVPGLDVGVVYEAAGEASTAGGDFYDLFALGGGQWCFAVGDVCGTGAEAAAVTGLARHTIRALARAGFPTTDILERLNSAIIGEGSRSRFVTLVCGTLRPTAGRVEVSLVCAGHPPPFVVRKGGPVEQIGRPQSLLGILDRVAYTADDYVLERGDLLVVVTDGVLERRDGSNMLDDDGLSAELINMRPLPAQAVAEHIRRTVVEFAEEPPRDDMAILAVRVGDAE